MRFRRSKSVLVANTKEREHLILNNFIKNQKIAGTIAQFDVANSKNVIFAVGKTRIQCSASLARAWLCDDEFKEGIRKDLPRKDGVQREIVQR